MVHLIARYSRVEGVICTFFFDCQGFLLQPLHYVVWIWAVLREELVNEIPLWLTHPKVCDDTVLVAKWLLLDSHCKELAWHCFVSRQILTAIVEIIVTVDSSLETLLNGSVRYLSRKDREMLFIVRWCRDKLFGIQVEHGLLLLCDKSLLLALWWRWRQRTIGVHICSI